MPPPVAEAPNYFRLKNTPVDDTPIRVALLLPFTNPSPATRAIAEAMQRSAELALFDSGNSDIILMPRDDGGSPELAVQAARQAINDGAEIILGPLFAQLAVAVGPVAREQGVPVISFSSDQNAGGNGVFLLSFQPETEVSRIVSYAAGEGHNAFAAMVPQDAYGEKIANEFLAAVSVEGRTITAMERFEPQPSLVGLSAERVAISLPDAILIANGGVMLQSLAPAVALRSAGDEPNKIAPFEALTTDEDLNTVLTLNIDQALNIPLPTSRDEVLRIDEALNACKMEEGLDLTEEDPDLAEEECEEIVTIPIPFRFLGTGLWDNPAVAREPILQNGWFAAPSPSAWVAFSARYFNAYGNEPPRISTLSYDAVSLVSLLSNGIPYQRFTDAALTDPNGFVGVDGIFRFNLDGVAERGLAVLEVNNGGFSVVDPAPASFITPGF